MVLFVIGSPTDNGWKLMTMHHMDLATLVEDALGPLASTSGSVLGVSTAALAPGRFYIMGLNPGGDPQTHGEWTIRKSISDVELGWSAHTHDCWQDHRGGTCEHLDENGRVKDPFLSRHQRNVLRAYDAIGATPGEVVTTNAIFARSSSEATLHAATGLTAWQWWETCWPVHQRMIAEVRPEFIVTLGKGLGTSAFGFLMNKMDVKRNAIRALGDNRALDGRTFSGTLPLVGGEEFATRVLGLPHPSYYCVGDRLREAIRAELNSDFPTG